jgi:hypothetical protein
VLCSKDLNVAYVCHGEFTLGTSAMNYLNEGWTVLQIYTQKQHIIVNQHGRKFCWAVNIIEAWDMRVAYCWVVNHHVISIKRWPIACTYLLYPLVVGMNPTILIKEGQY